MKPYNWRLIVGLSLLVFGVLALLQSFNIIQTSGSLWGLVPASIFLLGGWAFLNVLSLDRRQWWAAIPGVILAAIGVLILVTTLLPSVGTAAGGLIVLGGIGAAFWTVYFLDRSNWWAIIPAGTLSTLAIISLIPSLSSAISVGIGMGGLFFLGLAATFALVAILPPDPESRRWAWFPTGGLLFMAFLLTFIGGGPANYVWPAVLILVGIYVLVKTFRPHKN